ncbi:MULTISPECIES: tetratricopeptide repeat protein [unclassified Pseudomonas]|uniref:tetratricopeptide repeat protein n=1 Tax=unclassified Pseudomonas TaxID=196821 RepID=UPI0021BA8BAB|nr:MULTISPECIES: tetratricopeptide repeat protein [unclassified Pseudomonas]MCT8164790.1 tetratricopeptide repeat protein [Pseudomonas sp. HD6422]MCT8181326.1 tetratricopeptide repeat protein [Pseudomonas sp. HD6421]
MRGILLFTGLLLLAGCAGQQPGLGGLWAGGQCAKPDADQQLALNLADEMLNQGRPHASLAHLEQMPNRLESVRLRKARVLRLLGRSEAEPLYRSLLGGCLAAEGEHGLGQLASARGDDQQALQNLQRAVRLAPTDANVRNDLGVVLMNLGQHEQARFEFLTALELQDDNALPAVNLVTLSLLQDNWSQASDLVNRLHLKPEQFAEAQARAQKLRSLGRAAMPVSGTESHAKGGDQDA